MKRFRAKVYLVVFFLLSCAFCLILGSQNLPLTSSDKMQETEEAIPGAASGSVLVPEEVITPPPTATPDVSIVSPTPEPTGVPESKRQKNMNQHEKKARAYASSILKKISKKGMSKSDKLYAAYCYVIKNTTYLNQSDTKPGTKNWAAKSAAHTLRYQTGECYGFAAAFTYLAKEIGYEDSYVCYGKTCSSSYPWAPHGWAEIKIGKKTYLFDPEIEYKNGTCGKLYQKEYPQVLRKYKKEGRQ